MRLYDQTGAYDPAHKYARRVADLRITDALDVLAAAGLDRSDSLAFIIETATTILTGRSIMRGVDDRRANRGSGRGLRQDETPPC